MTSHPEIIGFLQLLLLILGLAFGSISRSVMKIFFFLIENNRFFLVWHSSTFFCNLNHFNMKNIIADLSTLITNRI